MASDFANMVPGVTEAAVQSLMDAKKYSRSIENTCESLSPLVENEEVKKQLEEVREMCAKISGTLQRIYNRNAREVFSKKPYES